MLGASYGSDKDLAQSLLNALKQACLFISLILWSVFKQFIAFQVLFDERKSLQDASDAARLQVCDRELNLRLHLYEMILLIQAV